MFQRSLEQQVSGGGSVARGRLLRGLLPRFLLQCWISCVCVLLAGSAAALETSADLLDSQDGWRDAGAVSCNPDALLSSSQSSGGQIECERPVREQPSDVAVAPEGSGAAPADGGEAPMCDETGASIGARLPVPELERGRLEVLPCEAVWALFGGKALDFPHAPVKLSAPKPPSVPLEWLLARADATRPAPFTLPVRGETGSLCLATGERLGASSGHCRPPYRPPSERWLA